jgi:hypothetical protein
MGRPISGTVVLSVSYRSGGILTEPRRVAVQSDGTFSIANVPEGEYVAQAISGDPVRRPEFGMQYVTVGVDDPAPVTIRTGPPSMVEGRLIVEGAGGDPAAFLVGSFPSDYDRTYVIGMGFPGSRDPDGVFRMESVTGPRRIVLQSAPAGWYLKSATLNGLDITDEPYDFGLEGRTFSGLEVVVANDGASVRGTLRDVPQQSGYSVLLYSIDRAKWFKNSRHVKVGRPTQDGSFLIEGIPAGEYFLVAVDRLEGNAGSGEAQDPTVFEALSVSARRLTLTTRARREVTLDLLRR